MTRSPECQSARMSKITNDDLSRSGTGCFITVPIWQQLVSKGLICQLYLQCIEIMSNCLISQNVHESVKILVIKLVIIDAQVCF